MSIHKCIRQFTDEIGRELPIEFANESVFQVGREIGSGLRPKWLHERTTVAVKEEKRQRRQEFSRKMVLLTTIIYWCYISAVLVQGLETLGFIVNPARLTTVASDSYSQFFIRVTGICLLPLTQFFWGFRHIPFQGVDATLASYSTGCARLFAKFHTLISLLLCYAMYHLGLSIPHGQCLLGMHLTWATIMTCALVQHHYNVHGYIIDTTSVPAAAKSFRQVMQGDDDEPRNVLQMFKGEDSSSTSVMELFQDEIKTD